MLITIPTEVLTKKKPIDNYIKSELKNTAKVFADGIRALAVANPTVLATVFEPIFKDIERFIKRYYTDIANPAFKDEYVTRVRKYMTDLPTLTEKVDREVILKSLEGALRSLPVKIRDTNYEALVNLTVDSNEGLMYNLKDVVSDAANFTVATTLDSLVTTINGTMGEIVIDQTGGVLNTWYSYYNSTYNKAYYVMKFKEALVAAQYTGDADLLAKYLATTLPTENLLASILNNMYMDPTIEASTYVTVEDIIDDYDYITRSMYDTKINAALKEITTKLDAYLKSGAATDEAQAKEVITLYTNQLQQVQSQAMSLATDLVEKRFTYRTMRAKSREAEYSAMKAKEAITTERVRHETIEQSRKDQLLIKGVNSGTSGLVGALTGGQPGQQFQYDINGIGSAYLLQAGADLYPDPKVLLTLGTSITLPGTP